MAYTLNVSANTSEWVSEIKKMIAEGENLTKVFKELEKSSDKGIVATAEGFEKATEELANFQKELYKFKSSHALRNVEELKNILSKKSDTLSAAGTSVKELELLGEKLASLKEKGATYNKVLNNIREVSARIAKEAGIEKAGDAAFTYSLTVNEFKRLQKLQEDLNHAAETQNMYVSTMVMRLEDAEENKRAIFEIDKTTTDNIEKQQSAVENVTKSVENLNDVKKDMIESDKDELDSSIIDTDTLDSIKEKLLEIKDLAAHYSEDVTYFLQRVAIGYIPDEEYYEDWSELLENLDNIADKYGEVENEVETLNNMFGGYVTVFDNEQLYNTNTLLLNTKDNLEKVLDTVREFSTFPEEQAAWNEKLAEEDAIRKSIERHERKVAKNQSKQKQNLGISQEISDDSWKEEAKHFAEARGAAIEIPVKTEDAIKESVDLNKIIEDANVNLWQQLDIRERLNALMEQGLTYEEAVARLREKYTQKEPQEEVQSEESVARELDLASELEAVYSRVLEQRAEEVGLADQLEAVYSRAFEQKAEKEKEAADEAAKFKEQQEKARVAAENLKEALTKVGSAIASAVKHAAKFAGHLTAAGSKGILNTLTFGLFKARKEATLLSKALQLAGVAGIGALFKNASSAANDLTDSVSLVNSTFGESAEGLHKWADETALYFNMSRLEAEKYFGKLGEYMRSAGLGTDASALMAKNLTARAGEMSSAFAGMTSEEATEQLYKVLSSERPKSAGAKIGLNLSHDALNAELLAEGIDRTYKSLSDAEKVVIKYNAAMRQLSNITGSTADGFDSWEGAVANLTANAKDALSSLGLIIQHYLLPVVQLLNQVMSAIAQSLRGLLGTLGIELPTAATNAADSFDDIGDSAEDAGDKASKSLLPIDKLTVLSDSKGSSGGGKSTAGEDMEGLIKPLDWLKDGMKKPMKSLQELLDILKKADWSKAGKKVAEVFNKIVKKISGFAKKLGEFDLGKKLADFVNGLIKDLDTKSLGDLFGTLFGNAQDTITSFLTNLDAQNIGQKLADLIIGFDLPKNLGKLGTNFSLLLNKIGETINGFLGGAKGAEVRKDIKDGIKNMLSNAISGINASELGEAIGNIAKTLGSALLGAAEGVDGLGKKLADVVNEAIATGGISDLAEGLANFLISALVEGVKFIASTDWLELAAEILKGIGKGIKDAVLDDPLVVAGALATIFAYSSLKKYLGLDALGKSICEDLGSGITANKGLVVAAAAGLATAVIASLKQVKEYIDNIIELSETTAKAQSAQENYKGVTETGVLAKDKAEIEKYVGDAGAKFDELVGKYNNLSKTLSEHGVGMRTQDLESFNAIVKDLGDMEQLLTNIGADDGKVTQLRDALQKIKDLDLSEGIGLGIFTGSDKNDLNQGWIELTNAVSGAEQSIADINKTIAEKNEELFKKTQEHADSASELADNAKQSTDELADAISKVAETDLPKFKENLEQTKQPMDDYLERAGKITELKYDGRLIDNDALQTNLDIAVGKVQQAAKDIDAAIANSTNLRNFEAVLDSTQTIKVDQSGTMNFKFDVTTKPDKDAFNKWQENYTYNNKKTVG